MKGRDFSSAVIVGSGTKISADRQDFYKLCTFSPASSYSQHCGSRHIQRP